MSLFRDFCLNSNKQAAKNSQTFAQLQMACEKSAIQPIFFLAFSSRFHERNGIRVRAGCRISEYGYLKHKTYNQALSNTATDEKKKMKKEMRVAEHELMASLE